MHAVGYINRDIKPANMCFGLTAASRHRLILIDYGLVRRYRTYSGQLRPRRAHAGFRGTLRYVSLRVHAREEPGPADDLIALFYSMLELVRGAVPWRSMHHSADIKGAKEAIQADSFHKIAEHISDSIEEFGKAVSSMSAEDEPNYSALQDIMKDMVGNKKLHEPYDWENEYSEVMSEMNTMRALGCAFSEPKN